MGHGLKKKQNQHPIIKSWLCPSDFCIPEFTAPFCLRLDHTWFAKQMNLKIYPKPGKPVQHLTQTSAQCWHFKPAEHGPSGKEGVADWFRLTGRQTVHLSWWQLEGGFGRACLRETPKTKVKWWLSYWGLSWSLYQPQVSPFVSSSV